MEYIPQLAETPVRLHLLVVDADQAMRSACAEIAASLGYAVESTGDLGQARSMLRGSTADILLVNLPAGSNQGLELVSEAKLLYPQTAVIAMTASGSVNAAVEAMRCGASDYLAKPFAMDELSTVLDRAASSHLTDTATRQLRERLRLSQGLGAMIGRSGEMEKLYRILSKVAQSTHPVLVLGESGTGKELVARSIHLSSDRRDRAFVAVNCGALTETLLESELFGHVKGSFTGAIGEKPGLFEEASGGTIFLDEIGETSQSFQVRLLRVLQEQEIRRVGGNKTIKVDSRVIAATNRDLQVMVKAGTFREDLYYRLSVVELAVPPLRDRREDIPALIDHFLSEFGRKDEQTYQLHPEARRVLEAYSWPGNVRELSNAVENLTQLSRGLEITVDDLPAKIQADVLKRALRRPEIGDEVPSMIEDWPSLDELERRYIQVLVGKHKEKQRIAEILGVDRTTLYRKLKRYGFHEGD
jgi:DNA-binding NtrC family response regulator